MATLVVIVILAAAGKLTLGGAGGPPGTDFASFYAAGKAALEGAPGTAYDLAVHYAREQALFGPETPFYAWQYPPVFLLVTTTLARLPYLPALFVWQAVSLCLYLTAILAIVRTFPPAGALRREIGRPARPPLGDRLPGRLRQSPDTARTASSARRCLAARSRASTAGRSSPACSSASSPNKPQLGLMIPVALLAGGRWRAIIAATLTVAALLLLAGLVFGPGVWWAFLASTGYQPDGPSRRRRCRLAQVPDRLRGGADVGRPARPCLCRPGRDHARHRPSRWPGCGGAARPIR